MKRNAELRRALDPIYAKREDDGMTMERRSAECSDRKRCVNRGGLTLFITFASSLS